MISIVISLVVVLLSCLYWYRRDRKLPPGPKGVPLLGVIPFLKGHSAKRFREWSKKYGSVFTVRVGQFDYVVLTEFDVINKVLVKQGGKVEARPTLYSFDVCSKGLGIIFARQRVWNVHRPFVSNTLRRLGMGKKVLETRILDESRCLVKAFQEKNGRPFDPKKLLMFGVVNVAASIILGQRFAYDDEEFNDLVYRLVRGWQEDGHWLVLLGYCSYLHRIPAFQKILKNFVSDFDFLKGIMKRFIKVHELTYDKNEIRDVIDAFIEEIKKEKHDRTYNEEQLVVLARDLLDAGAQTTTCTLLWLLVGLVKFPKYQTMLREEVDKVVGQRGTVTAGHRESMPMTIAYTYEVMRKCPMAAQSHVCTTGEVQVKGFNLPKGTPIFAVMWNVHHDPKYFDNPEEFRPERFINPEDGSFVKSKYCNPFSVGKRACVGEQLAQMELFQFLVNIVQRFNVDAEDLNTIPNFEDGQYGIVYVPPRFKLRFIERF